MVWVTAEVKVKSPLAMAILEAVVIPDVTAATASLILGAIVFKTLV
jgi:hypothetical protein